MKMTDMTEKPSDQTLPRNVKVLGLASLLNDISSEMIFPLMPSFLLNVLGGNRFYLGIIEGAADSVASLLKLWSGGRSDQVGRRKGFVVFGYSLSAITRPLIGVVTSPWQLLGIRITERIGKGIRTSPRDALIADSTDVSIRGRAFGFHRAMDHLGAAIGPLVAAIFLWFWPNEFRPLFLLSIIPGLSVVFMLAFLLREAPASEPPKERVHLTLKPFDGNFRQYLLALVVFTLGNSSDAFLLVRAGELGVPTVALPLLWCAYHILKSLGNFFLGRAVDHFSARISVILGWLVYAAVYLAFGVATSAWHAWALFMCYALFYGLTEPAEKKLVTDIVGENNKGLAYGWYNFTIGIGTLPASLIFGALYQVFGSLVAFGFGAALALVAIVLILGISTKPMEKAVSVG